MSDIDALLAKPATFTVIVAHAFSRLVIPVDHLRASMASDRAIRRRAARRTRPRRVPGAHASRTVSCGGTRARRSALPRPDRLGLVMK